MKNEESKTPDKDISEEQENQINIKLDDESTTKEDEFEKTKRNLWKKKNPLKNIIDFSSFNFIITNRINSIFYRFFEQKNEKQQNRK